MADPNVPEPAASEMTPEDAEKINSDVRVHGQPLTDPTETRDPESDKGAGNREAPHKTKETANDKDGKKGRAN